MASTHFSLRVSQRTLDQLEGLGRRAGRTRSETARMLIDEGLRMEQHPGIVFRTGPAGRRAGLAGGPDVWEVIRVLRELPSEEAHAIRQASEVTGLPPQQITTALRYYAEYQDEIDDWTRQVDREAERAEEIWRQSQAALGR